LVEYVSGILQEVLNGGFLAGKGSKTGNENKGNIQNISLYKAVLSV
jgi:hypothetical protein